MMLSRRGFLGAAASISVAAPHAGKTIPAEASPRREREYQLDRFFVAGFQYHDGPRLLPDLEVGARLRLVREPGNPHDHRAVALFHGDRRVGYVPRIRNPVIARLLDQGAPLSCRMTVVDRHAVPWQTVEVALGILGMETPG